MPRKILAIRSLFLHAGTVMASVVVSIQMISHRAAWRFLVWLSFVDRQKTLLPEQDSVKPPPLTKIKLLSEVMESH